jgi:hypothetical protein
MEDNRYTLAMIGVVSSVWILSLVALLFLWRQATAHRARLVAHGRDVRVGVRRCPGRVFNAGRFDLGFYTGTDLRMLASSFVLLVLLFDNGARYARLAKAHESVIKRLGMLREIDRAIAAEERPEIIARGCDSAAA